MKFKLSLTTADGTLLDQWIVLESSQDAFASGDEFNLGNPHDRVDLAREILREVQVYKRQAGVQ